MKDSTTKHLKELDDPANFAEEDVKVITGQEYVSRLHELKDEIKRAWTAEDRVTSLKLSIKVARLLMDTSVLQFYPTLFVLVVEIMDMLGNLVWERIKQKAEFGEDGSRLCYLSGPYPLSFCVFSLYLSLTLSFSHFHSLSLSSFFLFFFVYCTVQIVYSR